jgi:hypothetical protein
MVVSHGCLMTKNQQWEKIDVNCWPFQLPWLCASAMQYALPNRGGSVLHEKPLDASIGQVLALYCPGGSLGHQFWLNKKH